MPPTIDPKNKKILIVLGFAGILMIGLIIFVVMSGPEPSGPGRSTSAPVATPEQTVTIRSQDSITPVSTGKAVLSPATTEIQTPTPGSAVKAGQNPTQTTVITLQPTATGLPDPSGPVVPRPFTLSVSPASASGKPGETISYTLRIDGGEGQTEPIHFTLKASALFFTQTYEIGDESPPFPKTSVYQFTIPGNIPSGITINGVLTASGAGQTREQPVTLKVL
jgi:hypothetical protein